MDWGVATTVPANESKAEADLVRAGFETYFPRYESVEAVRGRIIRRNRPLFPGYLFFGLIDLWRGVFTSERITHVLCSSEDHPATLSQQVIDELRDRESPDGVIKFETKKRRRYGTGANVRVTHGAFIGYKGIVDRLESNDRLSVLFELFGRKTTVWLKEAAVTAG